MEGLFGRSPWSSAVVSQTFVCEATGFSAMAVIAASGFVDHRAELKERRPDA